jgi:hypothetical protein
MRSARLHASLTSLPNRTGTRRRDRSLASWFSGILLTCLPSYRGDIESGASALSHVGGDPDPHAGGGRNLARDADLPGSLGRGRLPGTWEARAFISPAGRVATFEANQGLPRVDRARGWRCWRLVSYGWKPPFCSHLLQIWRVKQAFDQQHKCAMKRSMMLDPLCRCRVHFSGNGCLSTRRESACVP